MDYKQHIKIVEDWPKEGIKFKDITPLMENGEAFKSAVDEVVKYAKEKEIDIVVGPEAGGLITASLFPYPLKVGLPLVRKEGNLPEDVLKWIKGLESGKNI